MIMTNLAPDRLLPIRPKPIHLESLEGYLIRVAEANSSPSVPALFNNYQSLLKADGVEQSNFNRKLEAQEELTYMLGLVEDESERIFYPRPRLDHTKPIITFGDKSLYRQEVDFSSKAVCPQCVTENGFISRLWNIRPYTACPKHEVQLITACHQCGQNLSNSRSRMLHCGKCGHTLLTSQYSAYQGELDLAELIESRIFDTPIASHLQEKYQPLAELPLINLLHALRIMRWFDTTNRNLWRPDLEYPPTSINECIDKLMHYFSNWPNHWHEALTTRDEGHKEYVGATFKETFKKHLDTLETHTPKGLEFMKDAFTTWLAGRYPIISFKSKHFRNDDTSALTNNYLTSSEAAHLLGVSRRTIVSWAHKGIIGYSYHDKGTNEKLLFDRDYLIDFDNKRKSIITPKEAAQILHVSPKQLKIVANTRRLKLYELPIKQKPGYKSADIYALSNKLNDSLTYVDPYDVINLTSALAMSAEIWGGLGPILEGIFDGHIRIAHYDKEKGIPSIQLSKSDIQAAIDKELEGQGQWLTIDKAAEYIHASHKQISMYMEYGLLEYDYLTRSLKKRKKIILKQSCDNFLENYITFRRIRDLSKKRDEYIANRLSWAGIKSVRSNSGKRMYGTYDRAKAYALLHRMN